MENHSDKFKWGLFYFDREDQRIFVSKGHWLRGWTLNFGNRFSYFILSLIVVIVVLINYFTQP